MRLIFPVRGAGLEAPLLGLGSAVPVLVETAGGCQPTWGRRSSSRSDHRPTEFGPAGYQFCFGSRVFPGGLDSAMCRYNNSCFSCLHSGPTADRKPAGANSVINRFNW